MNPFSLSVPNTVGSTSSALDLLVVDINSPLTLQLSGTATESDTIDIYESNLATITDLVQAQKIASIPASDSDDSRTPTEVGGTRARYLYVVRTAGSTAGLSLIVEGQSSASGVPGSTAWIQGGNSFGATGVLGTNDANDLQIRSNSTTRVTLSSAGAITLSSAAAQDITLSTGVGGDVDISADGNVAVTATNGDATFWSPAGNATLRGDAVTIDSAGSGTIMTCTAGNISMQPVGGATVLLPLGAGAGATCELRFRELAANGLNYTGFKSPDSLAGNVIYTLPTTDAARSGQCLSSDGAGTLSWRGAVNVQASNTSAQSIADGAAAAAVTGWTEVTDSASAFNPVTGVFTAPVAGFYQVSAELEYSAIASIVAGEFTVQVFVNGSLVAAGVEVCQVAAANVKRNPKVSIGVQMAATDTLDIRASQNSGSGANTLTAVGARNTVSIALVG